MSRPTPGAGSGRSLLESFWQQRATGSSEQALLGLCDRLGFSPPAAWISCAVVLQQGDAGREAVQLLETGLERYPGSPELRCQLAVVLRQCGEVLRAESLLRALLTERPQYEDAAFALGALLRGQGCLGAAAQAVAALGRGSLGNVETVLRCADFLKQCRHERLASQLCEETIASGASDGRLHAIAGEMAFALGEFERARGRYLRALQSGLDPNEWFILQALSEAQTYRDQKHPDFGLITQALRDPRLNNRARASAMFALGKAADDLGEYAGAASAWRQANALVRGDLPWSRRDWREFVDRQIRSWPQPLSLPATADFVPIFIVGLPRSGTTLLAEVLGRHPQVRNRGELNWIGYIAERLQTTATSQVPTVLAEAADLYLTHVRQDDSPVRWYVDKNPENLRHLGLIATLFPQARVVHCRRDRRDTALSIWSRFFARQDSGFAYDFEDIAELDRGCERLMEHWAARLPKMIHTVQYERFVERPEAEIAALGRFLGLPPFDMLAAAAKPDSAIASASVWQARQPIYRKAVQRWRHYAAHLPEMLQAFPE